MAVITTYDQDGEAESVDVIIHNITPTDTPFLSSIKSEKVNARSFEWIEDTLAAASATNAQAEGFTAADTQSAGGTMRENHTQILAKVFSVSGTSDAIRTYGRAKETAYQLSKALKEIKRDYELAMITDTTGSEGTVNGSPENLAGAPNRPGSNAGANASRQMTSIWDQITTNEAVSTNITTADINGAGQSAYTNGSDPDLLMIPVGQASQIGTFGADSSAGRYRNINDGNKTFVNAIDLIVTPFGEYRVVLNRHLAAGAAYLLDPTMFKACTLRPFTRTLLAKSGDNDQHMVVGEVSVKHNNFADSVKFTIS